MRLKLKNKIENVYKFIQLPNNELFIVSTDDQKTIKSYDSNKYECICTIEDRILSIYSEKNSFWIISKLGTIYCTKDFSFQKHDGVWLKNCINNKIYLSYYGEDNNDTFLCLYDLQTKSHIWQIDYGSVIFNTSKDHIFVTPLGKGLPPHIVNCYSYGKNDIKWQYDVSETGKYYSTLDGETKTGTVKYILGEYNNQLIALLKGGKFIALDVDSGELIWEKSTVDINNTKQSSERNFGDLYHPSFDTARGLIYILQGRYFSIFDLNTNITSDEWCSLDEVDDQYEALFMHDSKPHKGELYFIASLYGSADHNIIGIFNIEQRKVIWQHRFEFDKHNFIKETQMNDTHFYALDAEHNLYVFEREELFTK